jgi:outer membrane protein W
MYKAIITTTMVLTLACVSFAQEDITPNLNEGTKELRLHGSYDNDAPMDYELTLGVGYGYFFIDNLQVAVEANVTANDVITIYELGGYVEYNFPCGGQWVPFIGAGGFYVGAEVDDDIYNDPDSGADADTAVAKAGAGVKYFLRNDVAISLRADYSYAADDIYTDEDGNIEDTNVKAVLGLRFYFD